MEMSFYRYLYIKMLKCKWSCFVIFILAGQTGPYTTVLRITTQQLCTNAPGQEWLIWGDPVAISVLFMGLNPLYMISRTQILQIIQELGGWYLLFICINTEKMRVKFYQDWKNGNVQSDQIFLMWLVLLFSLFLFSWS